MSKTMYEIEQDRIEEAVARFPEKFGLRAFPGKVFRVSQSCTYVNNDVVYVYVSVEQDGISTPFAKGTVPEMLAEVVPLPEERKAVAVDGVARYRTLMDAAKLVTALGDAEYRESGSSPAWVLLFKVGRHLHRQAHNVMVGFNEDGGELAGGVQ